MLDAFRIFARYNRVANERLYEQVGKLDVTEYRRERRGSFGSIHAPAEVAAVLNLPVDDLDPNLPIQTVSTGMPFCIVPLRSLSVASYLQFTLTSGPALLLDTSPSARHLLGGRSVETRRSTVETQDESCQGDRSAPRR